MLQFHFDIKQILYAIRQNCKNVFEALFGAQWAAMRNGMIQYKLLDADYCAQFNR